MAQSTHKTGHFGDVLSTQSPGLP